MFTRSAYETNVETNIFRGLMAKMIKIVLHTLLREL